MMGALSKALRAEARQAASMAPVMASAAAQPQAALMPAVQRPALQV